MRTARLTQALKMLILSASLLVCLLKGGHLIAAPRPVPGEQVGSGYDIEMSRMIPMRDGVELEAWIFKPSQLKIKAPTVLELTQYDIDGGRHRDFAAFTQRGYGEQRLHPGLESCRRDRETSRVFRRQVVDVRRAWAKTLLYEAFPVGLFHPLQHAGLSRRTPSCP